MREYSLSNFRPSNYKRTFDENVEGVSVITVTNRIDHINHVFDNYRRQKIRNKELIIVLNNNSMNLQKWSTYAKKCTNVRIFKKDESATFAECKNYAISKTKFQYISHFDDDDYYGASFLEDILKAFEEVDADIIGKRSAFVYFQKSGILAVRLPGSENSYVKFVMDSSMVIKKKVFKSLLFPNLKSGADYIFQKECTNRGIKIYSVDKYNYAFVRSGDLENHSWKISDEDLLKECIVVMKTDNFAKHITK